MATAWDVVSTTPAPVALFWGPEWLTAYNAAFAALLTDHAPTAMGQPAPPPSQGLWATLGPVIEHVRQSGQAATVAAQPGAGNSGYGDGLAGFDLAVSAILGEGVLCIALPAQARANPDGAAIDMNADLIISKLESSNSELRQAFLERTRERDRMWHVSQDAFVVFDRAFNHVATSPAFESLLGWTEAEMIGRPPSGLIHPDDLENALRVRERLLAGEAVSRAENRVRHKDGSWRWLAWTAVPEGDRIYAVARDVTAAKQQVADLAAANRSLQAQIEERERMEATLQRMQRMEAIGQLTAGVAHDFNNLLTVIVGNLVPLARSVIDPRDQRRIAMIDAAALRGAKLTSQLLSFSRRQKLDSRVVDINDLLVGMRDLLDSSIGGTVRLTTALEPGLWPALVDQTQLELVILNLAINARDAMEVGGSLAITTANLVVAEPDGEMPAGEFVMVSVADSGTGMAPEIAARAFEPFFTTKDVGRGSGLGLAQVYGFAKQSGGGVRLETVPGRGTVISVLLPRADPALGYEGPAAVSHVSPVQGSATLMLVDDDEAVREVTAALLRDMGYQVHEAGSGLEALRMLATGRYDPDLVLLDFAMPHMNGVEVAASVRAHYPSVRVAFLTGYADLSSLPPEDRIMLLQKPYREDALQAFVAQALYHDTKQDSDLPP